MSGCAPTIFDVLHELWDDPADEGRWIFCLAGPHGNAARASLSSDAQKVWTVEAASHFEAMTLYHAHQDWGPNTTDHEWRYKTYAENGWE